MIKTSDWENRCNTWNNVLHDTPYPESTKVDAEPKLAIDYNTTPKWKDLCKVWEFYSKPYPELQKKMPIRN